MNDLNGTNVLHAVPNKAALLQELGRVLKPNGIFSVIPDHMAEGAFLEMMQAGDLFFLQSRQGKGFQFRKRANGRGDPGGG